jgi:hypothetical protein
MSPTYASTTIIFVLKVTLNAIPTSGQNRFSVPDKYLFRSGKKVQVLFYGLVISCLFSTPFFPEQCMLLAFSAGAVCFRICIRVEVSCSLNPTRFLL